MIHCLQYDREDRSRVIAVVSAAVNAAYALGNLVLGVFSRSVWFVTVGAYFFVLSVTKISCMNALRSQKENTKYIGRLVGLLLLVLCIVLGGSVVLSDRFDVVRPVHPVVMIGIATFTTGKTILAVVNVCKADHAGDPIWFSLRNISCADAAASILSMQRSMLVSFGDMEVAFVKRFNLLTGLAVYGVILLLGFSLMRGNPDA